MVSTMLVKEVSRALEEMAAIIARLQFVAAELQRAKQLELKRSGIQKALSLGSLRHGVVWSAKSVKELSS